MYARSLEMIQCDSENLSTGHEHRAREQMTYNLTCTWGENTLLNVSWTEEPCEEGFYWTLGLSFVGLEQHCPLELSRMMKTFRDPCASSYSSSSSRSHVAIEHLARVSATEEMGF